MHAVVVTLQDCEMIWVRCLAACHEGYQNQTFVYFGVNCCDHHSNAVTHHNCFPYPELPLQILLINDSPRIVGRSVSVDVNVSKPTQSLTCHLRQVGQELSNVQDCESVCDSESLAYSCFHFAIYSFSLFRFFVEHHVSKSQFWKVCFASSRTCCHRRKGCIENRIPNW